MRLRCYAEGHPGCWEAICLDLDIAAEGESFEQVKARLNEAISLYIEEVQQSSAAEQRRLLNRKAPVWLRLKYAWKLIRRDNGNDDSRRNERHEFSYPMPA